MTCLSWNTYTTPGQAGIPVAIEALEQYRGGGTMRMLSPYVRSILNARPNLSLAVAVSVGHQILRYMAWRSPTRVPLHDDWLNLTFDLVP